VTVGFYKLGEAIESRAEELSAVTREAVAHRRCVLRAGKLADGAAQLVVYDQAIGIVSRLECDGRAGRFRSMRPGNAHASDPLHDEQEQRQYARHRSKGLQGGHACGTGFEPAGSRRSLWNLRQMPITLVNRMLVKMP
jgi:hypothetical protein